jgi:hypothetical protein
MLCQSPTIDKKMRLWIFEPIIDKKTELQTNSFISLLFQISRTRFLLRGGRICNTQIVYKKYREVSSFYEPHLHHKKSIYKI